MRTLRLKYIWFICEGRIRRVSLLDRSGQKVVFSQGARSGPYMNRIRIWFLFVKITVPEFFFQHLSRTFLWFGIIFTLMFWLIDIDIYKERSDSDPMLKRHPYGKHFKLSFYFLHRHLTIFLHRS